MSNNGSSTYLRTASQGLDALLREVVPPVNKVPGGQSAVSGALPVV